MVAVGEAHSEDVQGWGGTRGSGVGNNRFTPEREGGVLRDRACVGGLEGLRDDGEMSDKAQQDSTRHAVWVQSRKGYRDSDLGGKIGT